MKPRKFTVSIREECEATTPEHAAREIAWRLIRWEEEKYGPLVLTVTDEEGTSWSLTAAEYAPVFTWSDEDGPTSSGVA